jgi:hypothetical protein
MPLQGPLRPRFPLHPPAVLADVVEGGRQVVCQRVPQPRLAALPQQQVVVQPGVELKVLQPDAAQPMQPVLQALPSYWEMHAEARAKALKNLNTYFSCKLEGSPNFKACNPDLALPGGAASHPKMQAYGKVYQKRTSAHDCHFLLTHAQTARCERLSISNMAWMRGSGRSDMLHGTVSQACSGGAAVMMLSF